MAFHLLLSRVKIKTVQTTGTGTGKIPSHVEIAPMPEEPVLGGGKGGHGRVFKHRIVLHSSAGALPTL